MREQHRYGSYSRLVGENMGKTWVWGGEWIQGHGIIWWSLWKHGSYKVPLWSVTTSCWTFRSSSLVMHCQDPMVTLCSGRCIYNICFQIPGNQQSVEIIGVQRSERRWQQQGPHSSCWLGTVPIILSWAARPVNPG